MEYITDFIPSEWLTRAAGWAGLIVWSRTILISDNLGV